MKITKTLLLYCSLVCIFVHAEVDEYSCNIGKDCCKGSKCMRQRGGAKDEKKCISPTDQLVKNRETTGCQKILVNPGKPEEPCKILDCRPGYNKENADKNGCGGNCVLFSYCESQADCCAGSRCTKKFRSFKMCMTKDGRQTKSKAAYITGTCPGTDDGGDACVCPEVYSPVCGNDKKTYSNKCFAECAKVTDYEDGECGSIPATSFCRKKKDCCPGSECVKHKDRKIKYCKDASGEATMGRKEHKGKQCPGGCICNKIYQPVCGNNGKTYGNKCEAKCDGIKKFKKGECPEVCTCNKILMPVCGNNGETYDNKCLAECDGVKKYKEGACSEGCICNTILLPVCGDNGKTYSNKCLAECDGVTKYEDGACKDPKEAKGESCEANHEYDDVGDQCVPVNCDADPCTEGQTCEPEDRQCLRAPCPQFKCVDSTTQWCSNSPDQMCKMKCRKEPKCKKGRCAYRTGKVTCCNYSCKLPVVEKPKDDIKSECSTIVSPPKCASTDGCKFSKKQRKCIDRP